MADRPTVYEPWQPQIGQRVMIRPNPECPLCTERDCAGATGIVESIDYSVDEPDPAEWPYQDERDPGLDVAGHYYWVKTDRPVRYRGDVGRIYEAMHGKPYIEEGMAVSAAELEPIGDGIPADCLE